MMQNIAPKDYVVSTGISHTITELLQYTFNKLDLNYKDYIKIDPIYYRPEELKELKGDSSEIRNELNWTPSYTFESMLDEMIKYYKAII